MEGPGENREIILLQGRKSDVWKYFGFYRSSDSLSGELDKSRVICTICERSFKYSTATSSTSNMVSHLTMAHEIRLMQSNKEEVLENVNTIKDATGLEGELWQHFGFYETSDGSQLDYTNAVCKVCFMKLRYHKEHTYNLRRHLQSYHDITLPRAKRAVSEKDELISDSIDEDRPLIEASSIQKPRSVTYHAAYRHFGFLEKSNASGELDESKVVCKICLHEYSNAGKFHPDYYMDHLKKKHNLNPNNSDGDELACYHNPLVKDLPGVPLFKSKVWKYFGFYALPESTEADRSKAICKLCRRELDYISSGVTCLFKHINRHGIDLQKDSKERKFPEDVGIFVEAHHTKGSTARTTYHSAEWAYFGFYAYPVEDGQNTEVDKSRTVCKLCRQTISFSGHIAAMSIHLHETHGIAVHTPGKYMCCNQGNSILMDESGQSEIIQSAQSTREGSEPVLNTERLNESSTSDDVHSNVDNSLQGGETLIDMQSVTHLKSVARAWDYFGFRETEGGKVDKTKAICKLCYVSLAYSSSTSNLNKHLRIKHGIYTGGSKRDKYGGDKDATAELQSRDLCAETGIDDDLHDSNDEDVYSDSKASISITLKRNSADKNKHSWEMKSGNKCASAEPAPSPYKSKVWRYFQFTRSSDGGVDKSRVSCNHCAVTVRYCGNTTNMAVHLNRYHGIDLKKDSDKLATTLVSTIPAASPYKSKVWNYFHFKKLSDGGLDKTGVICKQCDAELRYCGNTTNLAFHLKKHHAIDVKGAGEVKQKPAATVVKAEVDAENLLYKNSNNNVQRIEDIGNDTAQKEVSSESDTELILTDTEQSIVAEDKPKSSTGLHSVVVAKETDSPHKSKVWKYFNKVNGVESGRKRVVCSLCGGEYCYYGNTSNMSYHLKRFHNIDIKKQTDASTARTTAIVKSDLTRTDSNSSLENDPSTRDNSKRNAEDYVKNIIDKISNEDDTNPTNVNASVNRQTGSPQRFKSKVWDHFDFYQSPQGIIDKSKVVCKRCGHRLVYASSTKSMMNHVEKRHGVNIPRVSSHLQKSKVWDYMEFKSLGNGSVDKSKVCCTLCEQEFGYDGSTSNMMKHLLRRHNINTRADAAPYRLALGSNSRSRVWDYFSYGQDQRGLVDKSKVVCAICSAALKYKSSTTNMLSHLMRIHNLDALKMKYAQQQSRKVSTSSSAAVGSAVASRVQAGPGSCENQNLSEGCDAMYTEAEVTEIWKYFGKFEEEGQIDVTKVVCQICYMKVKYCESFAHMTKHLYSDHDIDIKEKSIQNSAQISTKVSKRGRDSDYENDSVGDANSDVEFRMNKNKQPSRKRLRARKSVSYYREDSISSDDDNDMSELWEDRNYDPTIEGSEEESENLPRRKKIFDAKVVLGLGKLTSKVWKYFGFYRSAEDSGEYDRDYAICKICRAALRYKSSTKCFHGHLKTHGINVMGDAKSESYDEAPRSGIGGTTHRSTLAKSAVKFNDPVISNQVHNELIEIVGDYSDTLEPNNVKLEHPVEVGFEPQTMGNKTQTTDAIAKFLCKDLQPFDTVESPAFQSLIQTLVPTYEFPSRAFFVETIIQGLYHDAMQRLNDCMEKADSLAITGYKWRYRGHRAYLTISVHLATGSWQLKTFVLTTKALPDSAVGEAVKGILQETFQTWKLVHHQRCAFVYDISTVSGTPETGVDPTSDTSPESMLFFIACFGQALNAAAAAGFAVPRAKQVLSKIRELVRLVRCSECIDVTCDLWQGLKSDEPEVWLTTLQMIEFICEQGNSINTILSGDPNISHSSLLDKNDTSVIGIIIDILTPIKKMTELIGEVENASFSLLAPLLNQALTGLKVKPEDTEFMDSFKNAVREKLNTSYSPGTMSKAYIAAALDPRFKSLVFLTHENRSQIFDQVLKEAVDLQVCHPLPLSDSSLPLDMDVQTIHDDPGPGCSSDIQQKVISSSTSSLSNLFGEIFQNSGSERAAKTPEEKAQLELVKYQNSDVLNIEGNAFQWWRMHEYELPLLARVAKCYLSIPLLCTKAKYLFTKAKHDLVSKRSILNEEDIDQQLFLESNV